MNSVAAVHHTGAPPAMVQTPVDTKVRPSPITPVIQNTNQVLLIFQVFKSHSNFMEIALN